MVGVGWRGEVGCDERGFLFLSDSLEIEGVCALSSRLYVHAPKILR